MPANPFSAQNDNAMISKNAAFDNIISAKNSMLASLYGAETSAIGNFSTGGGTISVDDANSKINALRSNVAALGGSYNYSTEKDNLQVKNTDVINKRVRMDNRIAEVTRNNNRETDPYKLLYASYYISILWTILATCLIYYIFTEL